MDTGAGEFKWGVWREERVIPDTVQDTLGHQILSTQEILLFEGQVGTASRLSRDSNGDWHMAVFKGSRVEKEEKGVTPPLLGWLSPIG